MKWIVYLNDGTEMEVFAPDEDEAKLVAEEVLEEEGEFEVKALDAVAIVKGAIA